MIHGSINNDSVFRSSCISLRGDGMPNHARIRETAQAEACGSGSGIETRQRKETRRRDKVSRGIAPRLAVTIPR